MTRSLADSYGSVWSPFAAEPKAIAAELGSKLASLPSFFLRMVWRSLAGVHRA